MYRRLASPLHAARAAVAGTYCVALGTAVLSTRHPLVLLALAIALGVAGAGARAGAELRRAARLAVPLAVLVALINPFVVREGLTVFAQLGEVPPFGQVDLTVEALVYGALDGARVLLVILACALFSATVDPDELLRGLRRVSFRSALTAVLALRLVPVLARDARRLDEARRCRPDGGGGGAGGRTAVLRAVTNGALDRALDVAATLEVRGYGARMPRQGRRERAPVSRHDVAFGGAAIVLLGCAAATAMFGVAPFATYPSIVAGEGPPAVALAVVIVLATALPFADRRGIER